MSKDAVKYEASAVDTEEAPPTPWYKRLWAWVRKGVRSLFLVSIDAAKSAFSDFINDERNQQAAKRAVLAAIKAGLRGDSAWAAAWKTLQGETFYVAGAAIPAGSVQTNWRESLLQLCYSVIKEQTKEGILKDEDAD